MITVGDAGLTIDGAYEIPGVAVWRNSGVAPHQANAHLHFYAAGALPGGGSRIGAFRSSRGRYQPSR